MAASGLKFRAVLAGTIAGLAFAAPAGAQDIPGIEPDSHVFEGDYLIVGVGGISAPTYEGSDNSRIGPAAGAAGEVAGIGFTMRGPSLSLDLVPEKAGQKTGFRFGPQVRLRSNRSGKVKDPVVARLGKLDKVIEAGFRVGVSFQDVLSKADGLSAGVSARWDVSGNGSGMIISPSANYRIPVSRGMAFGVLASAQFADGKYADYNYAISAEGALASGLPIYDAKGGLQEVSAGVAVAQDLNGDFLDGGFSVGAGALYSRLYGSAARSPITSIRGSRNQWVFGAGLGYIF